MYIFHISRTNLDTALLLVVFLIISFYTSESSADYPNAQIKNNTEYTVSGTVHYVSELCKNDSYSAGPGQTWKGSRRGVCLIGKIEGRIMLANQKGYNLATGRFDMPLPFNPKYQPVSLRNTNKSTYGEKTDVSEYLSDPATSYSKFQINAFGDRYRVFSDAEWAKASNTGQGKSPGFRFINKTAWPVAVSFDQVGCLYYGIVPAQFNGKPGEFRRDTGAVWFTIQAHIQPDGINPQTDWDCIKPVAELVGEVALAGMTGGGSVAASGARIAAKAAVKAAVKKGLKSVAKFGANQLGEYLTDSSSIKMVGQYAGYPWPVQCNQMPEYHITGGPVPSHDEEGEFYLEDGRPLKITKVNTCGNDMMKGSSKSETAEPVNISNYFNDSTPTTSRPPRASQPPTQRLLNTDIHNFNGMPFGSIDAAYDDGNGGVVMFSSRAYARYNLAQQKFIGGTASLGNFTGMPFTRVDAAFNDSNGGIVMFSGGTYARYNLAQQKFIGGTASLNNFTGMPFTTIDAAFNDGNGGIVMFSGGRYARYNLAQQKFIGGTASLSNFTGMPFTRVDASFPDRNTYKNTKIIMINKSVYQLYDMRHAQFENARTKLLDKKQLEARARLDTQAKLDTQVKLDEPASANEQNRLAYLAKKDAQAKLDEEARLNSEQSRLDYEQYLLDRQAGLDYRSRAAHEEKLRWDETIRKKFELQRERNPLGLVALVGFRVNSDQIIHAITPIYSKMHEDSHQILQLDASFHGDRRGGTGGKETILLWGHHRYIVTGFDIQRGDHFGKSVVVQMRVFWSLLGDQGIVPNSTISSEWLGTGENAEITTPLESYRSKPNSSVSQVNASVLNHLGLYYLKDMTIGSSLDYIDN